MAGRNGWIPRMQADPAAAMVPPDAMARAALLLGLALAGCSDAPVGPGAGEEALIQAALDAGLEPLPTEPLYPTGNPYNAERVELGRLLFFDPILSGPKDVACSTCHLPRFAFSDRRQFPSGAGAEGLGEDRTDPVPPPLRLMPRNSPTVFNVGLFGRMGPEPSVNGTIFWGGSAFGLEDQVLNPIAADNELRGLTYPKSEAVDSVLARLRAMPAYVDRFAAAYPDLVALYGRDPEQLVRSLTLRRALAAYLRELLTPRTPLDALLQGDAGALTARQKAGLELFIGKAECVACHTGPLLSDFSMHVLGAPQEGLGRDSTPGDDLGWGEVGGTLYAFRTPPLRQVTETAPYLHAGTAETLEQVMRFKNAGVSARPGTVPDAALDPYMHPLGLTAEEIAALVAFMEALTDTVTIEQPLFQAPAQVPSGLEIPK